MLSRLCVREASLCLHNIHSVKLLNSCSTKKRIYILCFIQNFCKAKTTTSTNLQRPKATNKTGALLFTLQPEFRAPLSSIISLHEGLPPFERLWQSLPPETSRQSSASQTPRTGAKRSWCFSSVHWSCWALLRPAALCPPNHFYLGGSDARGFWSVKRRHERSHRTGNQLKCCQSLRRQGSNHLQKSCCVTFTTV